MAKSCPRCKTEVTEFQTFCHSCGSDLTGSGKPPRAPEAKPKAPPPATPVPRPQAAKPAPAAAAPPPQQPAPPVGPQAPTQQIQYPPTAQPGRPGAYGPYPAGQPWQQPMPQRAGGSPGVVIAAVAGVVIVVLAICVGLGFFALRSARLRMMAPQTTTTQRTTDQGTTTSGGGSDKTPTPAAKPGEEAAVAAALTGKRGWVAKVTDHATDWTSATVIIGPPSSEFVAELSLDWNASGGNYDITGTTDIPPPDIPPPDGGTDQPTFVFDNSATELVDPAALDLASNELLCIARNEIYARHGLVFQSQPLVDWFSAQSWYKGVTTNPDAIRLNSVEAENVRRILAKEKARKSPYTKTPFDSW